MVQLYGRHHDIINRYVISVSRITTDYFPFVVMTIRSFLNELSRRETLMEQELLTILEHTSLPPDFSGVRDAQSVG